MFELGANKKGQTSVEYLLMIAVVASIVFGLLAFSGRVEQIIVGAKLESRDKLSGNYQLSPSDFSMGGLVLKDDDGEDQGADGAGGGAGRAGRARGRGTRGAPGAGDQGGLRGATTPDTGDDESGGRRGGEAGAGGLGSDYQGERAAGGVGSGEAYAARQAQRRAQRREAVEATGIDQVLPEGEEEEDGSVVMRRQEGASIAKSKTLAERDWGIGKFLIILVVIIFVIIFALKARQARD